MIDLHCHILPELDDGAQNLHQALEMARLAVDSGVVALAATPHCATDRVQEVLSMRRLLRNALHESGIALKIYSGMEIFGTSDTARMLREGRLLTLNRSRYALIEFPFHSDGFRETGILEEVIEAGFRPVVAHPERYMYIQEEPTLLNWWVKMGCLLQINKGSLLGRFGEDACELALALVDRELAAVVASDAHTPICRTTWMYEVRSLLEAEFGRRTAARLLSENPARILNNENICPAKPGWF